jgi:hypothetical protein
MIGFMNSFFTITLNHNQLQQLTINDCLRLAPFWLWTTTVFCLLLWLTWFWFMNESVFRLSHIATDGQSVCLSWCRVPSGAHDQILITVWQLLSCPWEGALSDKRTGLWFVSQSAVLGQLSVCTFLHFTCVTCYCIHIQYIRGLCQSGLSTTDCALFLVASL